MRTGWSCLCRWMIRIEEFGARLSWDTSLMRQKNRKLGVWKLTVCGCLAWLIARQSPLCYESERGPEVDIHVEGGRVWDEYPLPALCSWGEHLGKLNSSILG